MSSIFKGIDRMSAPMKRMGTAMVKFGRTTKRVMKSVNRSVFKVIKRIGQMQFATKAMSLVAVGSLLAVGVAIVDVVKRGDDLDKFARKLQVPVEALQEMQFVADRQGVSTENFRKSLLKMSRSIGEFRVGTGSLFTFLKATNDTEFAKDLVAAPDTMEAMLLVMERLNKADNPFERNALAAAAFGRAGTDMLIIAELGAKGIAKLRREGVKLGLVLSREMTAEAELTWDAMTNLKFALLGVRLQLGAKFFPVIKKASNAMVDWILANRRFIVESIDINKVTARVLELWELWKQYIPTIVMVLKGIAALAVVWTALNFIVAAGTAVQLLFNAAMFLNPIGIAILGFTLAAVAIAFWIRRMRDAGHTWSEIWHQMKEDVLNAIQPMVTALNPVIGNLLLLRNLAVKHGVFGGSEANAQASVNAPGRQANAQVEVLIRDETGRAEVNSRATFDEFNLILDSSGGF